MDPLTLIGAASSIGSSIFGAISANKERKRAARLRKKEEAKMKELEDIYANLDTSNPYLNLENTMEDLTIDQKQAEFERQSFQQTQANIMSNLAGAAGGSGVAGLAQVLANQGQKQAQQASASISMQEQANQARARGEAGRLQQLAREGEQRRDMLEREGKKMVEDFEFSKQDKMLEMALGRKAAADQAIDNANAQLDQFVSGAVTGGLTSGLSLLGGTDG